MDEGAGDEVLRRRRYSRVQLNDEEVNSGVQLRRQSGYKSTIIRPFVSSLSRLASAVIFASTVRIDTQLKLYLYIHHPSSFEAYNTCCEGGRGKAWIARAVVSASLDQHCL